MKIILKKILPPLFVDLYRYLNKKNQQPSNKICWQGDYKSWQEAIKASEGYNAPQILEKVRESTLKVKNGEAVYERDSVIFDKIQYNWPLLACLLKIAVENGNKLSVLDFGGSLGSSYFQNKGFLKDIQLEWSIVEQIHFVECGKKEIADDKLKFYYTIEECLKERKPHVLLLSGVLQYLDKPYEWIEKFLSYDFKYIMIDRTAFIENLDERLTVQYVPEWIYKASYPAWFFNENYFLSKFENKYLKIFEFDSFADGITYLEDAKKCYRKGFLLKLKI